MDIGTDVIGWIQNYAPSAQIKSTSTSADNLKNLLSQGCVFAVHSSTYSADGHYFSIIDINEDKTQVYVSNPWAGGNLEGWCDINEVSGYLDAAFAISNDGDLPSNSPVPGRVASTTTSNVAGHIVKNDRDGYKIDVDLDKKVEEIIQKLSESGNSRLLQYFSDKNRKKYLKSFLKSSIVTQYPDLRKKSEIGTEVPEGELQGVVKVRRRTESTAEDDKGEFLQYIPLDEFNNLKINADNNIFNYFTLDSNSNIVVAGYEKRTVEQQKVSYGGDTRRDNIEDQSLEPMYNITLSKMDYLKQIEKYTMPFDLLWTLLVYSQDEDFVYKLSELAIDTNIEITVHDNITYIDTTDVYNYTKNVRIHEQATFYDMTTTPPRVGSRKYQGDRPEEHYTYTITNSDYYESNNPILAVTYVDCWLLKYEVKYIKSHQGPTSISNVTTEADDNDYVDDGEEGIGQSSGDSLLNQWGSNYKSILDSAYSGAKDENNKEYTVKYGIMDIRLKYKKRVTGRTRTVTTINKSNTYQSQPGVITEKVDPNADEDNFVKLLKHSGKSDNLKSIAGWFFESIEAQESICDLEDLMKFLLYKTYNIDYGVTEFDFSTFDPTKFQNIMSGTSALSEFLKAWENGPMWKYMTGKETNYHSSPYIDQCITEDKTQYIMCDDLFTGNNNRNYGFGICFYVGGFGFQNTGYFKEEGVDITAAQYQQYGVSKLSVDIVDRIKEKIIEDKREEVRRTASGKGISLEDYQVDALAACRYQGWYISDFLNAYKQYGLNPIIRNYSTGMGTSNPRYEANWTLFSTGKYIDCDGNEIIVRSGGSILDCAERIHSYMEQNNYFYSLDVGSVLKSTFEESKATRGTCCATFVSWVLIEAGYLEPSEMSHAALSLADILKRKGFIVVNPSQMQAGDIISYGQHGAYNGHIEIYAGDGQIYNAGGDSSIRMANPYPKGNRQDYYLILRAPN